MQKSGLAPQPGSVLSLILYECHGLVAYLLVTFGVIFFVTSLQEGYYSYQYKMLGWTLLSAMLFLIGGSGLLLALWRCRMWFVYAVSCITVHNAFDHLICEFFPTKTKMFFLKPKATLEGFIAGVISCFVFFAIVSISLIFSFPLV